MGNEELKPTEKGSSGEDSSATPGYVTPVFLDWFGKEENYKSHFSTIPKRLMAELKKFKVVHIEIAEHGISLFTQSGEYIYIDAHSSKDGAYLNIELR